MSNSAGLQKSGTLGLVAMVALLAIITGFHYGTPHEKIYLHTFYRELYFIPILYVSFKYGLRCGLLIALVVTAIYVPHVAMTWSAQPGVNVGNVLQLPIFLIVAGVMGYISDRDKRKQAELRRSEGLASLGRAALAIAGEFQELLKSLQRWIRLSSLREDEASGLKEIIERLATVERSLYNFSPDYAVQQREFIEPGAVLASMWNELAETASGSGVRLKMDLGHSGCMLSVSPDGFTWMVEELVKNALGASRGGEEVTVSTGCTDRSFLLHVTDHGPGMDAETASKVFVPFYTTKQRGTGLGLAICQKMMRDNGGEVHVHSRLGEGTRFTLEFPHPFEGKDCTKNA